MPIYVQNNGQYGGPLINQKYAPLAINAAAIQNDNATRNLYRPLFTNRIDCLTAQNILPRQLNLYAQNWPALQAHEAAVASEPPIVVISSNRADWIAANYVRATNRLANLGIANFNDVVDIRAINAGAYTPTSWYDPRRINDANRNVYIVVHRKEYNYYLQQLAGTGYNIIGWEFDINRVVDPGGILPRDKTFVGFGASRYAALEFCKYLFNTVIPVPPVPPAPAPPPIPGVPLAVARQKAWLVDDNVAYVRGFPAFAAAENVLSNVIWGVGFGGATQNSTNLQLNALHATAAANMGAAHLQNQGILQQCVLWNIAELYNNHLNFSPYFITSNEDTSLSSFLQNQAASRLRISTQASVFKATPTHDDSGGARQLSYLRNTGILNFFDIEKDVQATPFVHGQGVVQDLNDYVSDYILPNAQQNVRNEWVALTESKAVEQMMAKVVSDRFAWVPALVFKPNGAAHQVTQHF
jgi:hypothetical protein